MNTWRHKWLGLAVVLVLGGIVLLSAVGARAAPTDEIQWDIVKNIKPVVAGGEASALASDGSMITVTGSGTFITSSGFVMGDGKWVTRSNTGQVTGEGTYTVKAFRNFHNGPRRITPRHD